jgi:hypothetical protein
MKASPPLLSGPQDVAEFERAFQRVQSLVCWQELDQEFPLRGNAVFINSVVLLMLLYQRMSADKSLEAAVKMLLKTMPSILPDNKRVTEKTLSTNPGGYAKARRRLPLAAAQSLAQKVSQALMDVTQPSLLNRRVFFFDGTTITLAPEPVLRKAFPPASNQYGVGAFPVALLTMAFELESGAAVLPEIGAMYGPNAISETAQVHQVFVQLPKHSVVMADAGFGIYAVANDARQTGHNFLLRLTASRFQAMVAKARLIEQQGNSKTYDLPWRPSAKDRSSHPELAPDAVLEVRLHEIRINDQLTLYLVTDLSENATELAELYRHRDDAEIDIRNFKVTLKAETLGVGSVAMFHKELWMSLVAYNLVSDFRRQAAQQAQLAPRKLSFKRVLTTFKTFLLTKIFTTAAAWRDGYQTALHYAMHDKLPNRPNRSYEREAYHQRSKSAQFKKRIPKNAPSEAEF